MKKSIIVTLYFILSIVGYSQRIEPAPVQSNPILISGGTVHQGNGEVLENGFVLFNEGKIDYVGINKPSTTAEVEAIDAKGKHIYPGFILLNTILGLSEISSVRASRDFSESSLFNPNSSAAIAYNTDSDIIPTVRSNGVLLTQVTPRGGFISGKSAVMQMDAWNWEDAIVKKNDGIHIYWPSAYGSGGWWANPKPYEINKKYNENIEALKKFLEESKSYCNNNDAPFNLRMQGMKDAFNNSINIYLHANWKIDIINGINMLKSYGLNKIVLINGEEAHLCLDILKENTIPVILNRVHRLPILPHDDIEKSFSQVNILAENGITVSIGYNGDMENMGGRNIVFTAGTAINYGLPYEDGVQLLSYNAARILGIERDYGSIEQGKSATLFISNGDVFDMKSSVLSHAFIDGRSINLASKQTELSDMYHKKYNIED